MWTSCSTAQGINSLLLWHHNCIWCQPWQAWGLGVRGFHLRFFRYKEEQKTATTASRLSLQTNGSTAANMMLILLTLGHYSNSWMLKPNLIEMIFDTNLLRQCMTWIFRYVHQGSIFNCTDEIFERSFNINVTKTKFVSSLDISEKCSINYVKVRSMFWMCQSIAPLIPDGGRKIRSNIEIFHL